MTDHPRRPPLLAPLLGALWRRMPLALLAALPPDLIPPREWLHRFELLVPGPTETRWLLLGDLVCLVLLGAQGRRRLLAIPAALGLGLAALNLLGMAVTDFYLGLALFHLAAGVAATLFLSRARWAGPTLVVLALLFGALT